MAEALLEVRRITRRFGAVVACDGLDLDVRAGEIHAVIGPNGAGKTTLLSLIAGELAPDAGDIRFAGERITDEAPERRAARGLARSFQVTSLFPSFSALDNAALAVQAHAGHSFRFWRPARSLAALREPAREALERVGLGARADDPAGRLSHGEQRQLEIAMALAGRPRLLLLDEPMAGLGVEESARMVALLAGLRGDHALLLVEHDMDAVFSLADRITVLDYGRAIASGGVNEVRLSREVREAYLGGEPAHA